MTFNILVLNSDRSAGFNFCKSLQHSKKKQDDLNIIGTSTHLGRAQLTCNDQTVLIPETIHNCPLKSYSYVEEKLKIKVHFVYETRSGKHMKLASDLRDKLPVFLPEAEVIKNFEDKYATFRYLQKNNFPVPDTYLILTPKDIEEATKAIKSDQYWVRAIEGYAGAGSLSASDPEAALEHVSKHNGWGHFTISEKLPHPITEDWEKLLAEEIYPGQMINWCALYKNGDLIAAQSRKRLYFEHKSLTPGGVSHTGGIMTIRNREIFDLADSIVRSFDHIPNGAIGIDFMADQNGMLKVTEIQSCRFFTTTFFMCALGLNFPRLMIDAFRENKTPLNIIDPIDTGKVWLQRFGSDMRICDKNQMLNMLENSQS